MDTFNWIVFLWQVSFIVSIITFLYGIFKGSWVCLLISTVTFLPIAYYFNGANNGFRLIALIPILIVVLAIITWRKTRKA
ncbi:hypothetical protein VBD025_16600 [Virgibacillus flavescens]|uniref:hypothetical protein n=1 Tax=Virgibacillus flavescens TaxID=1611422 RepID=UPI003D33C8CD